MMRIRMILWFVATFLLLVTSHNALPCSLSGRQLTVQIESGSAQLGAKNARALAEWFIQWRDGLGIESLLVVAPALKSNRKLAEERVRNIAHIFDKLNKENAPITYEVEVKEDGFSDMRYLNSIDVNMQPACIKLGTCCRIY